MAKPYSRVLSKDQYLNSFVDFYNQTLGTGISSSVAIDPTEDEENKQEDTGPDIFSGTGEDPSGFLTPTFTMISPEQAMSRSTKEVAEDRSDSYFKDFNLKEEIKEFYKTDAGKFLSGADLILGADGMLTGGYAAFKGISELNKRVRDRAAYDVYAAGNLAGSTLTLNGQTVVRRPGTTNYVGTVTGDPKKIYAQEQISYGYLPGTMKETQLGEEDGGNWSRTGYEGLLDPATAKRLGGNYDAYGNFHSVNGQSRYGTLEAGRELYKQVTGGRRNPTDAEVFDFMRDFRENFAAERSWWQNIWDVKPEDYANARKTTIEKMRDKYGLPSYDTVEKPPETTPPPGQTELSTETENYDPNRFETPGSTIVESSSEGDDNSPTYSYSGQDQYGNTVTSQHTYDEAGTGQSSSSSGDTTNFTSSTGNQGNSTRYSNTSSNSSSSSSSSSSSGGGGCCFIMLEARYGDGTMDEVVRRYRDEHMTPRNKRGYYKLAEVVVPLMRKYPSVKWIVTKTFADPLVSYGKYYYGQNKHGILFSPVKSFWMKVFDVIGQDTEFVRENGKVV
jgi:hypothetical protein